MNRDILEQVRRAVLGALVTSQLPSRSSSSTPTGWMGGSEDAEQSYVARGIKGKILETNKGTLGVISGQK